MKKFRKRATVETAVKNIQNGYQDDAPFLRTVQKNGLQNPGNIQPDDEPRSVRSSLIDDKVMFNSLQNGHRTSTEEVSEKLFLLYEELAGARSR